MMPRQIFAACVCVAMATIFLSGCTLDSTTISGLNDHPQMLSVKITVDAIRQGDTQTKAFVEFFRLGKAVQFTGKEHVYLQRTGDAQNELGVVANGADIYYAGMVAITDGKYDFLYVSDDGQQWPMTLYAPQTPTFYFGATASVQDVAEFDYTMLVYNDPQMYTFQLKFIGGYVTDYTNRTIAGALQNGADATGPLKNNNGTPYYKGTFDVSPQGIDSNGNSGGLATGGGSIGAYAIVSYTAIGSAWGSFTAELASPIYSRTVTWTN